MIKNPLFAIIFIALWTPATTAKDIYIAQNSIGAGNGSDCADARPVTWFNTATSWGAGGAQIGPGDTAHLCGTFTGTAGSTMLATQGNGSSENPITIKFEAGAVLQSPYFNSQGGMIIANDWIVVDGGTNGTIENTLNGTMGGPCLGGPCTGQNASVLVEITGSHDTVKNLIATHVYVHTEDVSEGSIGSPTTAIALEGSNGLATLDTCDNAYVCMGIGAANNEISFSTMTFCNHCATVAADGATVITGASIHDNNISQLYNWDAPDNAYHHNGTIVFTGNTGGTIIGTLEYNNYIHGIFSRDAVYGASHVSGWVFEDCTPPGVCINTTIFNNVLEADTDASGRLNYPTNGFITGGGKVYNNTIIGGDDGGACLNLNVGADARNNLGVDCGTNYLGNGAPATTTNYNFYPGTATGDVWTINPTRYGTLAAWQAGCSCDVNSLSGASGMLNPNYAPGAGSPAINAGQNLTSLGITQLNNDKNGNPRPASGKWDIGASNSGSSATLPSAPMGLSATVH